MVRTKMKQAKFVVFQVCSVEGDELPPQVPQRTLDTDDADRRGIDLGTSGRLHLMAKLAEGKHYIDVVELLF